MHQVRLEVLEESLACDARLLRHAQLIASLLTAGKDILRRLRRRTFHNNCEGVLVAITSRNALNVAGIAVAVDQRSAGILANETILEAEHHAVFAAAAIVWAAHPVAAISLARELLLAVVDTVHLLDADGIELLLHLPVQ